MNRLNQKLSDNVGWAINIYGGDRRLLCTLDPSHAWAFLTGIFLGACLMLAGLQSDATATPQTQVDAERSTNSAPLSVD